MAVINPIGLITPVQAMGSNNVTQAQNVNQSVQSFGQFLNDALNKVNDLQKTAEQASVDLAAGKITDIHDVMIATEKASLAISMAVQVRNKVIDAYQEMMRMQV